MKRTLLILLLSLPGTLYAGEGVILSPQNSALTRVTMPPAVLGPATYRKHGIVVGPRHHGRTVLLREVRDVWLPNGTHFKGVILYQTQPTPERRLPGAYRTRPIIRRTR